MTSISIIGAGNIGQAVAGIAAAGGHQVQLIARDAAKTQEAAQASGATPATIGEPLTGEVVVLAVPYPAVADVLAAYGDALAGKVVVDPTNPLDFSTFDSLVVPADTSAAAQIQAQAPGARVLKAFNTTFAATLASRSIGGSPTTVLIAGDDADAKALLADVVRGGGLEAVDAGALSRARELEALGFLQLTLAAGGTIPWTGGFGLVR
ncbi:NADPH-dependent F420 reductase [Actinotalea ferrariae]|uniref:NADPH-dependent F420 reductase n=1 Tax=Actinotalea ferrariae TaxID=1386098 RepID=UPI001C8BF3AD|nr:NADPH-dependent F420 reductase [Actinotalea ferrariae]MBX9245947.1 NADPH-dependent F420 reductase [Actinotalea ferrariae]